MNAQKKANWLLVAAWPSAGCSDESPAEAASPARPSM